MKSLKKAKTKKQKQNKTKQTKKQQQQSTCLGSKDLDDDNSLCVIISLILTK